MGALALDLELVAEGLTYPTGVAFDADGVVHVAEAGLPFAGAKPNGRVKRIENGHAVEVISGLRPPVNGLVFCEGLLLVAQGGAPAELSRFDDRYVYRGAIASGFSGPGNYHLNAPLVGPDDRIYFSQGAMTNTGVVGLDAYEIGWLRRLPHAHDVPGHALRLCGQNFRTANPLSDGGETSTGAFVPFGTVSTAGQLIEPGLPCTASIMRCRVDGSDLELVAWGLRNAFGMCFLADGGLVAIDQGADDRGSRPVGNAPDLLFEVNRGRWYGWPDFIGGHPITSEAFIPVRGERPNFLLANHNELPRPEPARVEFAPHSAAAKLDIALKGSIEGLLVVALFGDERPMTAPDGERAGRCLVAVEPGSWAIRHLETRQLSRPIDVRSNPLDGRLYVVDFGHFEMTATGVEAKPGSGAVWRQRV